MIAARCEKLGLVKAEDFLSELENGKFGFSFINDIPSKDGSIITIAGNLSLEEEKDAKILAYSIDSAPTQADFESGKYKNKPIQNSKQAENENHKRKKAALYLRFKNENDENIALAKRVTDIFDGNIPLYFYYTDDKRYALQPQHSNSQGLRK